MFPESKDPPSTAGKDTFVLGSPTPGTTTESSRHRLTASTPTRPSRVGCTRRRVFHPSPRGRRPEPSSSPVSSCPQRYLGRAVCTPTATPSVRSQGVRGLCMGPSVVVTPSTGSVPVVPRPVAGTSPCRSSVVGVLSHPWRVRLSGGDRVS